MTTDEVTAGRVGLLLSFIRIFVLLFVFLRLGLGETVSRAFATVPFSEHKKRIVDIAIERD